MAKPARAIRTNPSPYDEPDLPYQRLALFTIFCTIWLTVFFLLSGVCILSRRTVGTCIVHLYVYSQSTCANILVAKYFGMLPSRCLFSKYAHFLATNSPAQPQEGKNTLVIISSMIFILLPFCFCLLFHRSLIFNLITCFTAVRKQLILHNFHSKQVFFPTNHFVFSSFRLAFDISSEEKKNYRTNMVS